LFAVAGAPVVPPSLFRLKFAFAELELDPPQATGTRTAVAKRAIIESG